MEGKLDKDGTFTGHAEQLMAGDAEVLFRSIFRELPESQWKDAVQRVSQAMNFGGDVSNVKLTPPDELDKPFQISWDYVRKNYADWEEHKIIAPLPPLGLEVLKDAKDIRPPEPVLLGALGKVSYRSQVALPEGYKAEAPAACHLNEAYASYDDHVIIENGVMTTNRELKIKQNEVPLSDWEGYRKFGRALADDEFSYIALTGGEGGAGDIDATFREAIEAMQQRNLARAETLLQKVISARPNHPMAHLDLAGVLMVQGKMDEALSEFHKAQEVSPQDLRAYRVPAWYLVQKGRTDDAIGDWHRLLKADPKNVEGLLGASQLLNQEGKYSDAVQELEGGAKAGASGTEVQFALGEAYIKTGNHDKAFATFQQAVEQKPDDPIVLNNVAYALAENKTHLDLAQQYAEKAVKQLEAQSIRDVADADSAARVAYQLSLTWDTLGWVYFQNGDTNRSESYVRASWLLDQQAVVGEHLGEIYEKEGKESAAAHTYALTLAALAAAPTRMTMYPGTLGAVSPLPSEHTPLANEITSRYQKLTGMKPSLMETRRLPNGEWSKSVVDQLSEIRTVRLGKQPNLMGSAEFSMVFVAGKVEAVDYESGEESLKALTEKIKEAHYQVEFPAESQARLRRRGVASCSSISGCMIVLMPPELPRAQPAYFAAH
jgi:tetratricopeptide (TPR) repeat protein